MQQRKGGLSRVELAIRQMARPAAHLKSLLSAEGAHPLVWLMCGMALWLLSHPYWGIWHDARVYTLMAVRWLNPDAFVRDPWFMFGSQDAYSIFSPLYASTISWIGVDQAARAWSLGLGVAFVFASWMFSRAFAGRFWTLFFAFLVASPLVYCVNDYSVFDNFRVSESFVTARHLAVSLSLLGLAFLQARKPWVFFSFLLLALLIHPLMAIWALLAAVAVSTRQVTSGFWLGICIAGSLALALLAWSSVGPFEHLAGDWRTYTEESARIIFVDDEGGHRSLFAATAYALLALGTCWGSHGLRRWYFFTLTLAVCAYAVFWFASHFAPAALIMKAQLWRVNWIASVFALLSAFDLIVRGIRLSPARRWLSVVGLSCGLIGGWVFVGVAIVLFVLPKTIFLWVKHRMRRPRAFMFYGASLLLVAVLLVLAPSVWRDVEIFGTALPPRHLPEDEMQFKLFWALAVSGTFGLLPLLAWLLLSCLGRKAGVLVAAISLLFSLAVWDLHKESDYRGRFSDVNESGQVLFGGRVKPGDVVYWQGRPEYVWYLLGTASYASSVQAIGIVFSEPMTMELARRLRRVALADADEIPILEGNDERDAVVRHRRSKGDLQFNAFDLHSYEADTLTPAGLGHLCADPALDFVVSLIRVAEWAVAIDAEKRSWPQKKWHLYDCRMIGKRES